MILTRLGGEYSEAVVPEAARDDEARVDSRHETVTAHLDLLAEVVAEMASMLQRIATGIAAATATAATDLLCTTATASSVNTAPTDNICIALRCYLKETPRNISYSKFKILR